MGLASPDNTSEGELPKRWFCEDGKRLLAKGSGPLGQEPYNEAVATALHRRVLSPGDFVPYEVRHGASGPMSVCPLFLGSDEEYVPAQAVLKAFPRPSHRSFYQHYLESCAVLGVEGAEQAVGKMIMTDDLIANHDRHYRNFGLVRNVETLACRPAPLFDSGSSLWCDVPTARLARDLSFQTKPFHEDANRQLRLVDDYSWLRLDALDGFVDEAIALLSENPAMGDRLVFIREGMERRLRRLQLLA